MVARNKNFERLKSGYLFPEIQKRKKAFLEKNPDAKLISLGIGDTTEPIPEPIAQGLLKGADNLGTRENYTGYNPPFGVQRLREQIALAYYDRVIDPDDIFISDGSKSDIGRLQMLFGPNRTIALQEPAYPAYIDTTYLIGSKLLFMPCTPGNDFFPDLDKVNQCDIIFFCSPHNPTGTAASKKQLESLVACAKKKNAIILFDSAYRDYIQDPKLPKSIYEIEGAKEVAIEVGSFSKSAGFTGVRLGWSVVPKEITYEDGSLVRSDWARIVSTFFNGASNIAQTGGMHALQKEGLKGIQDIVQYYLQNARLIKEAFKGLPHFGGIHSPYIWVQFPGLSSWEVFEEILHKTHIVSTPGSGFGPSGEGFVRFSAFGTRETIKEAADRLREYCGSKKFNLV